MNRIKEMRLDKNMSQENLARRLNLSLRHMQRLEIGTSIPSVYIGIALSEIFGQNIKDIFPNYEPNQDKDIQSSS